MLWERVYSGDKTEKTEEKIDLTQRPYDIATLDGVEVSQIDQNYNKTLE